MAEDRKAILVRIPPELWEQLNSLANAELRSLNAQIEFLLREGLTRRGRNVPQLPPSTQAQSPTANSTQPQGDS